MAPPRPNGAMERGRRWNATRTEGKGKGREPGDREPGLRRDRHRQGRPPPGGRSGPVPGAGAVVRGVAGNLPGMAEWLSSRRAGKVAMEPAPVYWIPAYEVLERAGSGAPPGPPGMGRRIPGRGSDVPGCQWIRKLLAHGLLRGAFRPGGHIRPLRPYVRRMGRAAGDRPRCVPHMRKALAGTDARLDSVTAGITGASGLGILRATGGGGGGRRTGPRRRGPDGGAADAASGGPAPEARRPASRGMAAGERATAQAPRRMMGVGLTAIPAIGVGTALTIAAEAGPDMPAFPSARHPAPGRGWRREPGPSAAGPCRAARQRWPAGWRRPRPWPPCPPAGARPPSAPGASPASPGRTRRWRSPRPPANPRASSIRWSRGGRDTWSGAWRNTGGGA